MSYRWIRVWGATCVMAFALTWGLHAHQARERSHALGTPAQHGPRAPIKITPEELHRLGGVPPGWQFRFPDGDPSAGRAVFAKLECYQCHTIQGETFPQVSASPSSIGPELTGMGDHHPVEYFAESILNPNAIIVLGPGYTDAEGMSIMPDFRDSMTVAEFVDLLAYLQSLKGGDAHKGEAHHAGHDDHAPLLDQVVGDYRIRITYHEAEDGSRQHGGHSQHGHAGSSTMTKGRNHLMAAITDAKTAEPVPYLPVSVTIATTKQKLRTVKLKPMIGDQGFHYGTDVTFPSRAAQVTLSVGATRMHVMTSASGRYTKPHQVSFDWKPQPRDTPAAGDQTPPQPGHGKNHRVKDH